MVIDEIIEHAEERIRSNDQYVKEHAQFADLLRGLKLAKIEIDLLKTLRDGFKTDAQKYKAENAKLRELLTDYYKAPCMICNPWAKEHQCKYDDGEDCLLATRALELGIEIKE